MKKAGLVGGIGPASTLEYYRGITEGYRERVGGGNYPPLIIDSLNLAEIYDLVDNKQWDEFAARFVRSIKSLAAGGAEFAAMAANTAHIVFDAVRSQSPLPLVSLVEETSKAARAKGCRRIIVFGTGFTMRSGMYTEALAEAEIEAFVPEPDEQSAIHNIIFPHLEEGIVLPEEKETMLEIARRLISEKKADALLLGCTELPLIIKPEDLAVPVLDTTQIHIDAILDNILA